MMVRSLLAKGVDDVVASSGENGDVRYVQRRLHFAAGHYGPQWVKDEVCARRQLHSGRGKGAMVATFRVCGRHRELLMFTTFAKTMA